jgi:putative Mn2+ efflux pump MntP
MSILEIIISSLALAMDAFAVAVCKGLSMKKFNVKTGIIVGLYFGLFQSIMPLIGYFLGSFFEELIVSVDHWVAFVLLGIIGFNMIKEALSKECECSNDRIDFKTMFPLAIATSIDALAVGITMAFLKVNIFIAVLSIGIITFILSFIGVWIGNKFGSKYEKKAQLFGGIILVLIGLKILLEHLGIF